MQGLIGHVKDLGIPPNINGGPAHPARGVFLKHGPSCHFSVTAHLVIIPSEQILSLSHVVKCFMIRDEPIISGVSPTPPLYVSLTLAKSICPVLRTLPHSVPFHNWLTPFPLPEMSSSFFLPFSFWQRPTHILWAGSKTKVSKRPSQTLPDIQGSQHAYSSVPALGCSPW